MALNPIMDVCDKETCYEGGGEDPGAVVGANSNHESSECYVKINFNGGKGEALKIWNAWRGRRRQGISRVGGLCRERWVSVCWDGDR